MKSSIFTILRDEPIFLEIWLEYYSDFFYTNDIYVIHHKSNNKFDDWIYNQFGDCANIETISYDETFDHEWLRSKVQNKQRELLKSYDVVTFAEIDEIIWHPSGLDNYISNLKGDVATCRGFEVVHFFKDEPPIDLDKPLLQQRKYGYYAKLYDKTLISKVPLEWCWGFHHADKEIKPSMDLHLIHLHKMDFGVAWERNLSHKHTLLEKDLTDDTPGIQNLRQKREWLENWWMLSVDGYVKVNHINIPSYIKEAI